MTDLLFTSYGFPATGTPTSRTMPDRLADVYNVKDFGAEATGSGSLLSSRYGTLAAAQADYPLVTTLALTDTIDWAALQSAINTMWASTTKTGTVFIPAGSYVVSKGVDIGSHVSGSANTSGRIVGVGRGSFITGNLNNEFILNQGGGINGPEEISSISVSNISKWIGSGGIRMNNSTATLNNVSSGGMIAYLFGWDIYNASLNNCTGGCGSDPTTGYNGTLGFAGFTPNIKGWRSTNPMMAGIQVSGSNSAHIDGCGIENCVTALLLGTYTGWASHCTAVPDSTGTSILTVTGMMGSGGVSGGIGGNPEFLPGMTLFGRGLAIPAWGSDPNDPTGGTTITGSALTSITDATTTITSGGLMTVNSVTQRGYGLSIGGIVTGVGVPGGTKILSLGSGTGYEGTYNVTPPGSSISARTITAAAADTGGTLLTGAGYQGTYRINGTYTITTPIPIWTRSLGICAGLTVSSIQTEACFHSLYVNKTSGCHISGVGCGSNPIEVPNQFGTTGLTPRAPFYINSAAATVISGCAVATAATQLGSIYMDPTNINHIMFEGCIAQKGADNVVTAKIDNGSGGSGNILNVSAFTSGISIGVGMLVTGTGVTVPTRIIANHLLDNTLTGTNTTGTYRVDTAQNVASRSMTVVTGPDWVMPTDTKAKARLKFINCTGDYTTTGLGTLNMTFGALPGQGTADPYIPAYEGLEYNIVDGQKSGTGVAAIGDAVQGGGTQHIKVWYNGTSWIRFG